MFLKSLTRFLIVSTRPCIELGISAATDSRCTKIVFDLVHFFFNFNLPIEVEPCNWAYVNFYRHIFVKLPFDVFETKVHCLSSLYKLNSSIN